MNSLRVQLEVLIGREIELAQALSRALAREHEALRSVDPDALDEATDAKQRCVSDLSGLDVERRDYCAGYGLTADRDGMHALCVMADSEDGPLLRQWQSLLALLETCQQANQRNGAVVSSQRRRVDDALGLLRGTCANTGVYDAQGEIAASDASRVHAEI